MQFEIRSPASGEDIKCVMRDVFGDAFEEQLELPFDELLQSGDHHGVVICVEGDRAGSIMVRIAASCGLLYGLGVLESYRLRGIADHLISTAISEVLALDPNFIIFAAVERGSVWEERYQSRGFRLVHVDRPRGYLLLMYERAQATATAA